MLKNEKVDVRTLCKILDLEGKGLKFFNKNEPIFINDSLSKLGIDAIYFIDSLKTKIPVIYFKELEKYDADVVVNLHRRIWNEGKSPFLVIILPSEIRVYNTFIPTPQKKNQFDVNTLIEKITLFNEIHKDIKKIRKNLGEFSRDKIDSGELWKSRKLKFENIKKIDIFLLENLKLVRNKLSKLGLSFDIINQLLIRAIFISYMQDRKILTKDYFKKFGDYQNFIQILSSTSDTYRLFNEIHKDFNGDVFYVTDKESSKINVKHLSLIRYFLSGAQFNQYNNDIQTSLFPYCFDTIPIELISSIYEEFLKGEDKKESNGSHYTPYSLVELSLDKFYQYENLLSKRILDPSCGSGIFLVESYRRIVEEWYYKNNKLPDWKTLKELLVYHIYGVDINEDAVRVAIFSLYLKMLDFLEPRDVWKRNVKFPHIYNKNIINSDFFDKNLTLEKVEFDYFIGNPPWESLKKDSLPVKFCNDYEFPISDNQIAQAFIWKLHKIAKKDSKACLILPAKSILFNKSETNQSFRGKFFENHNVKMIMNLSSLRHHLFRNAVGPSIIAIYTFREETKHVLYINPKSSYENKNSSYIIINSNDIINVPKMRFRNNIFIWKILMWGNFIDSEIIQRISINDKLENILDKNELIYAEGFVIGRNGETQESRLKGMPLANTNNIKNYYYDVKLADKVQNEVFYRVPRKRFDIFLAPHLLIRKNALIAAYTNKDVAFTHAMLGIHGKDTRLLKYISVLINSTLMRYYFFLTASAWAVERDNIHSKEIKKMPIHIPQKDLFDKIVELHDAIQQKIKNEESTSSLIKKMNRYVYLAYELTPIEVGIIETTLSFSLSIFEKGTLSISYEKTNKDVLVGYVTTLLNHINQIISLNKKYMNAEIYFSSGALEIITLSVDDKIKKIRFIENNDLVEKKLQEMSNNLKEKYSESIYLKKDLRLYLKDQIVLIKFNEKRFWSFKQAIIESNRLLSEIVTGERCE